MKYKQSKNKYDKRSRSFEDKKDDELYQRIKNNTFKKTKQNKTTVKKDAIKKKIISKNVSKARPKQKLNLEIMLAIEEILS